MSEKYRHLYGIGKQAVAVLTPEAEQAAMQPPMDPAMAAGGGAPMNPMAAGGMPPAPGAGAAPVGGDPMAAPAGGQIPPEILQDQMFIQFLQEALGVSLDPASGMFMGPNGEPIPPELIIEAYQEFQTMQAQGGMASAAPAGGAGMPPEAGMPPAAGADPAMAAGGAPMPGGAAPMDPMSVGVPPEAAGGVPQEMGGAPAAATPEQDPVIQEILSSVEAVLQAFSGKLDKQLSAILDKIDALKLDITSLRDTTDQRSKMEEDEAQRIREELEAELTPTSAKEASISIPAPAPIQLPQTEDKPPKRAQKSGVPNLFSIIQGGKR